MKGQLFMNDVTIISNIIIMVILLFLLVFDLYAVVGRKIIRFNIVLVVNLIAVFIFIGMAMMPYMR